MSAECERCGHDVTPEDGCGYCALSAENERLRALLGQWLDTYRAGTLADRTRAALAEARP